MECKLQDTGSEIVKEGRKEGRKGELSQMEEDQGGVTSADSERPLR